MPMGAHTSGDEFRASRWSLANLAGVPAADSDPRLPLRELCLRYWPPVYAYLRRSGEAPEVAEALTARFMDRIVEDRASAERTRDSRSFRTFLLGELRRFLGEPREGLD